MQLSALIGDIYNAALEPNEWPVVLAAVCRYVGGSAAMIYWHDSVFLTGDRYHSWGDDPVYTKLYFETYVELNPAIAMIVRAPVGNAVAFSSLIAQPELRVTRFFKEWMWPQGYIDNVFANLDSSPTAAASFAVARHIRDGMVDGDALGRMQLLVPHMQRAVLIGKVLEAGRTELTAMRKLVDGIAASIFLVDRKGAILHFNEAAARMLEDGDMVSRGKDGGLLLDRRPAYDVRNLVASVLRNTENHGGRFSLPLTGRSGRNYLVHLLSLKKDKHKGTADATDAVVAVFIRPAEIDTQSGLAMIAQRYRLTPREIDVLRGLVENGGVPEVARREGISARTVKAHLSSIFAKTGTARQADLVKLLAIFAAPL